MDWEKPIKGCCKVFFVASLFFLICSTHENTSSVLHGDCFFSKLCMVAIKGLISWSVINGLLQVFFRQKSFLMICIFFNWLCSCRINFPLYLHSEVEGTVLSLENNKKITGNFLLFFLVLPACSFALELYMASGGKCSCQWLFLVRHRGGFPLGIIEFPLFLFFSSCANFY